MIQARAKGTLFVAGVGLMLLSAGCGKKAPLRLTDDRTAERAPPLRASVRAGQVTLDFRVPAHRFFPEREEPWVLARILRQAAPSAEIAEAGAILKAGGFAFDSPLTWTDQVIAQQGAVIYRVEFRDAVRRRRALSEPLTVAWDRLPAAPTALTAEGRLRSIVVTWTTPPGEGAGTSYRIYRREPPQALSGPASSDLLTENSFVDSRIEAGREYCYEIRAVLSAKALEVEGPASREHCIRAASEELPPAAPPASAP